jgi:hypothetical protein
LPIGLPAGQPIAAEGPDGTVFIDDQPAGAVYVVDGDTPPAIAEHVSGTVSALAASGSDLYVATFTTLYDYNRSSGNVTSQVTLPPVSTANISNALPVAMTYAAGQLWVLITKGNDIDVYRLDPGTGSLVQVETSLGATVGTDGTLYYENTSGNLVSLTASGTTTTGPHLSTQSNGEGGGVQFVDAVAGGYVWTQDDAGQGLDADYQGYSTTSLAAGPSSPGTAGATMADTLGGPLFRSGAEANACPSGANACVLRIGSGATLSDGLATGAGAVLLGPYPALVGPKGDSLALQRLS